MSFLDSIIEQASEGNSDGRILRGAPVGWSRDMDRILALPRRVLDLKDPRAAVAWTKHLRLERYAPCDCVSRWGFCITDLNPVQGWALEESMDAGGVICSITVGGGKTGIGLLLPMAIPEVNNACLIVPAGLKAQLLKRDFAQWSAHFKTPNLAGGGGWIKGRPSLHIVSYTEVSNHKKSDLFKKMGKLDLVIADECQGLADRTTTTTKRFFSIWKHSPKAKHAPLSGTLTKKSIRDHSHLDVLALREKAPVPHSFPVVEEWAALLDASKFVSPTGMFRQFMNPGESARSAFCRRFTETFGVIATSEIEALATLTITERVPTEVPKAISEAIDHTVSTLQRPDGEELVEEMQVEITARQIAAGFYYRWAFTPAELPLVPAWLKARKEFFKELREELKNSRENYDSPKLLCKAAIRWHDGYSVSEHIGHQHTDQCRAPSTAKPHEHGSENCEGYDCVEEWDTIPGELICGEQEGPIVRREIPPYTMKKGPYPTWKSEFWPAWKAVHKTVHPVTQAVWIDDFLVRDAAAWLKENNGIAWFEFVEFGRAVANMAKVPYYGGGEAASADILLEDGSRPIVASIKAHGTGKNLQRAFSKNLVMNPPSDGAIWEQLIGRTHRPGQKADDVTVELYRHTKRWKKAFDTACGRARYIQETLGSPQRLCFATYGNFLPDHLG